MLQHIATRWPNVCNILCPTMLPCVALKWLHHNILSHCFDGINNSKSVAKPENNGLLRKKNTKRMILEQKETIMA